MKVEELIAACNRADGLDGTVPDHIYLVVPKKTPPGGEHVRLAGRSGPLGRVCNAKETETGFDVVAVFKRKEVLAFAKLAQLEQT